MIRRPERLAFWSVLCVAAFLRFAGLPRASFFHYDEGETAKSALGPAVAARWALAAAWAGEPWSAASLKSEYREHGFPYARTSARPGFLALAAASMTLFGVSDLAVILVPACLGVLTVALLFAALRRCDPEGGWTLPFWAALSLAVWPTHVFFSRTGFAHVPAGFFLTLSFFLYVRAMPAGGWRPAFGTGLVGGMAFACHFNVAWSLAVFGVLHAVRRGREGTVSRWIAGAGEIASAAAGAACPVLFFQAATALTASAFPAWLPDQRTYLEDLRAQWAHLLHYCNPRAEASPFFYLIHAIRTETPAIVAGVLAGSALLVRRARRTDEAPSVRRAAWFGLALFWLPFIAASLMRWKVARTLVPIVPFGAVLWGYFLSRFPWPARWGRSRAWIGAALLAGPFAVSAGYLAGHGQFRAIIAEARKAGAAVAAIDEFPVADFYAGHPGALLPRDREQAEDARIAQGGRLFFIALWKDGRYGFDDPVYANRYPFLRELVARGVRPSRTLPFGVPVAYEHLDRSWNWPDLLTLSGRRYAVHLFDLDGTER